MVMAGNSNHIKMSLDSKIVVIIAYILVGLLVVIVLVPFLHVIAKAFSSGWAVFSGSVGLWPVDFTTENMHEVLTSRTFHTALKNSLLVTGLGTVSAICFSALVAYPLSQKKLPFRRFWLLFFVFTMYFSGGLIPTYLLYNSYHLLDTRLILFLPHIINTYHLLIIKNYYEELPEAIFESAQIDGASHWTIFTRIVVPLSKPVYATIAVFTSVILWNSYRENLTIQSIAERIYLSPNYICMVFKQATGQTINQYTTQVRMEQAKKLLAQQELRIMDIGAAVGYAEPGYFNKLFKKYAALTPKEYRQMVLSAGF